MEHGMPEHEVEALVLERQLGGVTRSRLDLQPQISSVALERLQHARRDVGAGRRPDHPVLHQVSEK